MKFVRWLVTVVGGMMALPIVTGFFVDYAKQTDAYKKPEETLGGLWGFAVSLAHNPYFSHAAALAVGLALGLWADSILRRIDGSRATRLRLLGYEFDELADRIEHSMRGLDGEWPRSIMHMGPDLLSAFLKGHKLGVAVPTEEIITKKSDVGPLLRYLRMVGKLLVEEQFDEAKDMAKRLHKD